MNRLAAAVAGLAGLVIVLVVAGCSAGQNTQTDSMEPSINGAIGQVGPIAIRDARFAAPSRGVYPAGAPAELILTIVNSGATDDELSEVTSSVADGMEIHGDRAIPARRFLQAGGGAPIASSSSVTATSRLGASASGSATAQPTTSTPAPVELGKTSIVLTGLNAPLYSGKTYPVTFVFRKAGSVTIQLPIANPPGARPEPTGESHG